MNSDDQNTLQEAKNTKKENEAWLKRINNVYPEVFSKQLIEVHKEVFAKTNCLECANCCKTAPPLLKKEDVNRIAKALKISSKMFVRTYVLEDFNGEMSFNGIPCKFLLNDNSCSIYDIRPESCRRYPHTDEKEYPKRSSLNLANTMVCPAAFNILTVLKKSFPTL